MTNVSLSQPVPSRIWMSLLIVRGGYGLTLGLYLYITQAVLIDALRRNGLTETTALGWSTGVFAFSILWQAAAEYPTGAVADTCGRKTALVLGFLFRGLFFLTFLAVWAVGRAKLGSAVVLASAFVAWWLFGIGYTLLSGSTTSWLNDALDEAGCAGRFNSVLAWGNLAYWMTFLVGALLAIILYGASLVPALFALGALTALTVALVCVLITGENKYYEFHGIHEFFGSARKHAWEKYKKLWQAGALLFRQPRNSLSPAKDDGTDLAVLSVADARRLCTRLWIITLVGAAVHTLRDYIDYTWVEYSKGPLGLFATKESAAEFGRLAWLCLALTLVYLIGHGMVLALTQRWERQPRGIDGIRQVGLTLTLNVLFSLPLCALAVAYSSVLSPGSDGGFLVFIGLITCYALFQGASDSPREALDNHFIPQRLQERSTVLSLMSLIRKVISGVVLLVLAFVVRDTTCIVFVWAGLAVIALVLTALTPLVFAGHYDLPGVNGPQPPLEISGHATGSSV